MVVSSFLFPTVFPFRGSRNASAWGQCRISCSGKSLKRNFIQSVGRLRSQQQAMALGMERTSSRRLETTWCPLGRWADRRVADSIGKEARRCRRDSVWAVSPLLYPQWCLTRCCDWVTLLMLPLAGTPPACSIRHPAASMICCTRSS